MRLDCNTRQSILGPLKMYRVMSFIIKRCQVFDTCVIVVCRLCVCVCLYVTRVCIVGLVIADIFADATRADVIGPPPLKITFNEGGNFVNPPLIPWYPKYPKIQHI
jgi:hypothetical protein